MKDSNEPKGLAQKNKKDTKNLIGSGEYLIMFQKFYGHYIICLGKFRQYFCVKSLILSGIQLQLVDSIWTQNRYKSSHKAPLEITRKRRITQLYHANFPATVEFFNVRFHIYFWDNSLILIA